jgi:hypothetical protein
MQMDEDRLTDYSEDGVDLTLIRWMLSMTPAERLQFLQRHANAIERIRELNPEHQVKEEFAQPKNEA